MTCLESHKFVVGIEKRIRQLFQGPPLSHNLFPVPGTMWGIVGQGVVRVPTPVADLRETVDLPLLHSLSQRWSPLSPCSAAPLATKTHHLSKKQKQVKEPWAAQSLDLHLSSLIVISSGNILGDVGNLQSSFQDGAGTSWLCRTHGL